MVDDNGQTALYYAAEGENIDCVELLLQHHHVLINTKANIGIMIAIHISSQLSNNFNIARRFIQPCNTKVAAKLCRWCEDEK